MRPHHVSPTKVHVDGSGNIHNKSGMKQSRSLESMKRNLHQSSINQSKNFDIFDDPKITNSKNGNFKKGLRSISNISSFGGDSFECTEDVDYTFRHLALKKKWMVIIANCLRLKIMEKYCNINFSSMKDELERTRRRYFSMLIIGEFMVRNSLWAKIRIRRRREILRKHGWRIILYARCLKRKKAVIAVRNFFQDFRNFRLAYLMLRYRTNAINLQNRIRNFIMITNARVLLLTKLWIKYEKQIRDYLLPKLKVMQQKQTQELEKANSKKASWEGEKLVGVALPELATNVNSATKLAVRLKQVIQQGEQLVHRVHVADINNRIKKMKHKPDDKDVIKVKRRKKGKKINSNKNINDAISARERAIRTFLSECRRNFKLETAYTDMSQTHARNVKAESTRNRVSTQLAVMLLKKNSGVNVLGIENSISELLVAETSFSYLRVYTGENSGKFYCIVEDYVRKKIDEMLYSSSNTT